MIDATDPRPSVHSTDRLRDAVQVDTGDLRARLTAALQRAAELEAAGRVDLAVAVLEEQRAVLADVHASLERRVAGALVEHEAEVTLRAAVTAPVAAAEPDPEPVLAAAALGPLGPAPSIIGRIAASALAAVAGIVLLLLPDAPVGTLGIAGTEYEPGEVPAAGAPDTAPELPGGAIE